PWCAGKGARAGGGGCTQVSAIPACRRVGRIECAFVSLRDSRGRGDTVSLCISHAGPGRGPVDHVQETVRPPVAGNLSHRAGGDVPDTARDTVLDVDHVGTSHPPLPRSPVLVLVVLVHVISFPLVGLDARWTPRRGVTGQTVSNPRLDWGWTPVWTGVGHRSGLGLERRKARPERAGLPCFRQCWDGGVAARASIRSRSSASRVMYPSSVRWWHQTGSRPGSWVNCSVVMRPAA